MLRLGSSGLPQWSVSLPPDENEPGVLGLSFPLICLPGLPSGGSPLALPPSSFLVGLREEKEVTLGSKQRHPELWGQAQAQMYDRKPRALLQGRAKAEEDLRWRPGQRQPAGPSEASGYTQPGTGAAPGSQHQDGSAGATGEEGLY